MAKPTKNSDSAGKSSETASEPKRRGRPPLPPEQRKQRTKGEVIHLYPTRGDPIEQALGRAIELRSEYGVPGSKQARIALRDWMPLAMGKSMEAFRVHDLTPTLNKLLGTDWLKDAGGAGYVPDILHVYENVAAADSSDPGPTDKVIFSFLDELYRDYGVSKSHSLKAAMSIYLTKALNSAMVSKPKA